ncbi:MAG: hypothetical protein AB7T86_15210 [Xanthobacteraceae bacterium]|uniref:hypothetical protein n=1 Tax=Pseudolabrys sp. TaxID=1960880 RepID=UPI003D0D269A
MRHLYSAFLALLIVGSAGYVTSPAQAGGYRYDPGCNCNRPIDSTRTVREAPRVIYNTRVVNTRRVVPRYRTEERNQLVVHVRPVIRKDVVVHREHVHYQNIVTRRINTINRYREEERYGGVEHRRGGVSTSSSTVVRTVQGTNCNCGGSERVAVGGGGGYRQAVSYRY